MTTHPNTVPTLSLNAHTIAPRKSPPTRLLSWSIASNCGRAVLSISRRSPSRVFLVRFLHQHVSICRKNMRAVAVLDPMQQRELSSSPTIRRVLIMAPRFSWRSLLPRRAARERRDPASCSGIAPVSDLTPCSPRPAFPIVVLPTAHLRDHRCHAWIMLAVSTTVLLAHGMTVAPLWTNLPLFQMSWGCSSTF